MLAIAFLYVYLTRTERRSYYCRREEVVAEPLMKTSIIIDGMDQSKTNLPHFKGWVTPKVTLAIVTTFLLVPQGCSPGFL